jgi:hypothetical protein
MATSFYNPDVTRNVEPVVVTPKAVDPSSMVNAIRMEGEATRSTIKAVGQAYETKKFKDVRQAAVDAEAAADTFFQTNMAAERASQLAPLVEQEVQQMESIGPLSPIEQDALQRLKEQTSRLRYASQAGMSMQVYESRVAALTKQALAKYPGLAQEIRQTIGGITGVEGADRWAASRYISSRFNQQADKDSSARTLRLVEKDIDDILTYDKTTSREELMEMYATDRVRYNGVRARAAERAQNAANTKMATEHMENLAAQGRMQLPEMKAGVNALFNGLLFDNLTPQVELAKTESNFRSTLELAMKGEVSAQEFALRTQAYTSKFIRSADTAFKEATAAINDFSMRYGLAEGDVTALRNDIKASYEAQQNLWGDKNAMLALALSTAKFENDTYQKQYDRMKLSVDAMNKFGPDVVRQFFLSPNIMKVDNPKLFSELGALFNASQEIISNPNSSFNLNRRTIDDSLAVAKTTGNAPEYPEGTSNEVKKAGNEQLFALGVQKLADSVGGEQISSKDKFALESAFTLATSEKDPVHLARNVTRYKQLIEKAPEDVRNTVKVGASAGSVRSMTAINSVLDDIEAKYGVRLQVGVNSAGDMGVINAGLEALGPKGRVATSASTPNAAVNEFNRRAGYLLMNLVNGTYIVSEDTKTDVAANYADIINNKGTYTGFFSLEAQPVRAILGPAVTGKIVDATEGDLVENLTAPVAAPATTPSATTSDQWWEQ